MFFLRPTDAHANKHVNRPFLTHSSTPNITVKLLSTALSPLQSKPLQNLSKSKPPSSAFCRSATVSVAGQFIVHLTCLVATLTLCESHMIDEDHSMSADGKFQPNVVNSAVFLLSAVIQVDVFCFKFLNLSFLTCIFFFSFNNLFFLSYMMYLWIN